MRARTGATPSQQVCLSRYAHTSHAATTPTLRAPTCTWRSLQSRRLDIQLPPDAATAPGAAPSPMLPRAPLRPSLLLVSARLPRLRLCAAAAAAAGTATSSTDSSSCLARHAGAAAHGLGHGVGAAASWGQGTAAHPPAGHVLWPLLRAGMVMCVRHATLTPSHAVHTRAYAPAVSASCAVLLPDSTARWSACARHAACCACHAASTRASWPWEAFVAWWVW
jgi:hypothetical protein